MKRFLLIPLFALAACATEPDAPADGTPDLTTTEAAGVSIGDAVPSGDALSPDELIAQADDLDGKTVTVEGTVREVCQQAGCWLSLADAEGRTVRVEVPRDESESYEFTFPKDLGGSRVRLSGMLDVEMESVEDQRHYAQDGGASEAEAATITEPKRTLVLTAIGAEVLDAPDANA